MREPLRLDQNALATFEDCPRRFQLRYVKQLPWPGSPLDRKQAQTVERGRQFHRLAEQQFLGLPVKDEAIGDDVVRGWWKRFAQSGLVVPDGSRWPEHHLTIPIGRHFLSGRFDLLVLGEENGGSFARVYDWKTSRPRSLAELSAAWQTRIYLALLAESGEALSEMSKPLAAEQISLTYWYPAEPEKPRVIRYSEEEHKQNLAEIQRLIKKIDDADPDEIWPLTENQKRCRSCMYQSYCGRQEAGLVPGFLAEEAAPYTVETTAQIEPETP